VLVEGYELIDVGDGARLERFGAHLVDRPHAGALAPRRAPARWTQADLRFDRDRGWSGPGLEAARAGWSVRLWDTTMLLRPTDAGQVGLFPEHAQRFPELADAIRARHIEGRLVDVLNLFAYTGLATLALAGWGATLTHVDASRPAVGWARQNAAANGRADHPVRWIVEDARTYVRREARRGRRYDVVVLDPPSYGHGGGTATWRLETDLAGLLRGVRDVVHDDGVVVVTTHTEGVGADRLEPVMRASLGPLTARRFDAGDVILTATSGAVLPLGAYAVAGSAAGSAR
jgi:23S rRNA (cytosine1962-C5)-methyltransferase